MEIISSLFNTILYQPLFNLLIFFYNVIPGHDFGLAIILVTLLIRIFLFPLSKKGLKSRKALEELQLKIKEIQKKYKNKEEQAQKLMEIYKEHKVNPASGCLPTLIQLPIFIALYLVLKNVSQMITTNGEIQGLYSFILNPGTISPFFLGVINLAVPNFILAFLAGISQFIQGKIMLSTSKNYKESTASSKLDIQKTITSQMTYFMPIFVFFISLKLPAGLPLYWTITTLFGLGEYYLINKEQKKNKESKKGKKSKN